jgi:threonine dehydrogenase-like Zn-dependent dehydrogenase
MSAAVFRESRKGAIAVMRALVVNPPSAAARGRRRRRVQRPAPHLEVRDIATPVPHAPGWVLVRPALAGICPSDLTLVQEGREPVGLAAQTLTRPLIPGHEVVGVIERASATRWAKEGHRVLVEPTLTCAHKGLPECPRCRAGDTHLCENADRDGALCSGRAIGSSEQTGGGWSEGFLVHEDMLVPADGISDQRGVLAEPAAAALHAVLRWSRRGERAVVIGGGTLTSLIVATLRRLAPNLDITVILEVEEPASDRRGRRRGAERAGPGGLPKPPGADRVWRGGPEELIARTADQVQARIMRRPEGGLPVLDRGVDVVFDCNGTAASLDLAVRMLRGGGSLVLSGPSGRHAVEWPLIWARELLLCGAAHFGREPNGRRTFAVIREWLTDSTFPVDALVTHRFPLDEFGAAIETAVAGQAVGAVKVVFEGPVASFRRRATADDELAASDDDPVLLHATAARVRETHRSS